MPISVKDKGGVGSLIFGIDVKKSVISSSEPELGDVNFGKVDGVVQTGVVEFRCNSGIIDKSGHRTKSS